MSKKIKEIKKRQIVEVTVDYKTIINQKRKNDDKIDDLKIKGAEARYG